MPDNATRPGDIPDIATLLHDAIAQLADSSPSARLDAEVLLAHAVGRSRAYLRAHPETKPAAPAVNDFQAMIARRAAGEPVAHLVGGREFWSLDIHVTRDTLIPRPETETLVEAAVEMIAGNATLAIADLGTGSGAIALAIAHECPRCRVIAVDISGAALAVAQANAERLRLGNIEFRQGEWCAALADGKFDMIVSNPPYVAASDPHLLEGDVRFEPRLALSAGSDGLDEIHRIAACAGGHLRDGGHLLLEHGYDQGERVRDLLRRAGFASISTLRDIAGHERVTQAIWNENRQSDD